VEQPFCLKVGDIYRENMNE